MTKPKTGERRKTRQPLKIDKLPVQLRDVVLRLRAVDGKTWDEIEQLSPAFEEWKDVPANVLALFPGRRLPESTLHRWYDLRVEQVKTQQFEQAEKAREIARHFADGLMPGSDVAVQNALRDQVFALMQSTDAGSRAATIKGLTDLGFLLAQFGKLNVARRKQATEEKKLKLIEQKFQKISDEVKTKLEKGKPLTAADIDRIRERTFGLPPEQRRGAAGNPA